MALPSLDDLVTGLAARLKVDATSMPDLDRASMEGALADASALVTAEGGSSATGGDDDAPAASLAVLYASAKRAYMNTTGAVQETTGPFGIQYGTAWLTQEERRILGSLGTGSGLWTQGTTRGEDDGWVFVSDPDSPNDPIPLLRSDDFAV